MNEQEFYDFVKAEAKKHPNIKLARLEVWGRDGSCAFKTIESKKNFLVRIETKRGK